MKNKTIEKTELPNTTTTDNDEFYKYVTDAKFSPSGINKLNKTIRNYIKDICRVYDLNMDDTIDLLKIYKEDADEHINAFFKVIMLVYKNFKHKSLFAALKLKKYLELFHKLNQAPNFELSIQMQS